MLTKNNPVNTKQRDIPIAIAWLATVVFVLAFSCNKSQQTAPTVYSSASSLSYAMEYPSRLEKLNQKFLDASAKARSNWNEFGRFAGALNRPRWDQVKTVYKQADMAGRSEAIVDWMRQSGYITEFIESNDGTLAQRIGTHVNSQINKKEDPAVEDIDSRPFVRWALKDATEKLVEKRYRELNEAHRFVAMYGETLGKKNLRNLEGQVDSITEASFIVYILLIDLKQQVQTRVDEAGEVKNTLDNEIEGLQLIADDPASGKDAKAAASRRISELLKVKAPIDAHTEKANKLIEEFELRLEQFQKEYQDKFSILIDAVEQMEAKQGQP